MGGAPGPIVDWAWIIAEGDVPLMIVCSAVALYGLLIGLQFVVGNLRKRIPGVTALVDNAPLFRMDGPEVLDDNLRRANVTEPTCGPSSARRT